MEITEVRVKLTGENAERLRAFCSVTFDGEFVIRDLKIIDGTTGPFLAMPSRKLSERCPKCGHKNHLRAKFCNDCGGRLEHARVNGDEHGRGKLHADVAHPINTACRERLQKAVIEAYQQEVERSMEPGYKPVDLDDEHAPAAEPPSMAEAEEALSEYDELIQDLRRSAASRSRGSQETGAPAGSPSGGGRRTESRSGGERRHDERRGPGRPERRGRGEGGRGQQSRDGRGAPERPRREPERQTYRPAEAPVEAPVEVPPQPVAVPPQDDEDSFGAGLI